jgi:hypothetical protein
MKYEFGRIGIIERRCLMVRPPASYSRDLGFKSRPGHLVFCGVCGFPQSLQENARMLT